MTNGEYWRQTSSDEIIMDYLKGESLDKRHIMRGIGIIMRNEKRTNNLYQKAKTVKDFLEMEQGSAPKQKTSLLPY